MPEQIDHKEMHRYVMGEIRNDGWKSQWLLDLEGWIREEKIRTPPVPKPIFRVVPRTPPVKAQKKAYPNERRAKLKAQNLCRDCMKPAAHYRSYCQACLDKRAAYERKRRADKRRRGRAQGMPLKYCTVHPDVQLNLNNRTGVCKPCYRKMRYQIEQARKAA